MPIPLAAHRCPRSNAVAELPGDFNHDGIVAAADYVAWRKTGGSPDDYNDWQTSFGATLNPGSGSGATSSANAPIIPEPCSFMLLAVIAVARLFWWRRRAHDCPRRT